MITNISREDVCIVVQSWFKFPYCFTLIIIHYHTPQKRGIKFKPRKKLNHKTGGHFACAWVHPLNNIELAHQIWWREIEKSRKVTILLKAILLVLWIPYFPTKDVLHDKNRTFLRGFSVVDFLAVVFLEILEALKRLKAKNRCSCINLIFTGKAMRFYGLISKLMVLLIKEELYRSNVQLL